MAACSYQALFVNIKNREVKYQRMMDSFGDGVACLAGHLVYDIFAYAENSMQSRIFLYTYPEMKLIETLTSPDHSFRRILCLAFSETDNLVVLTSNPDYSLEVWNWRANVLLFSTPTDQISDTQYIRYIQLALY